ncbi:hypothetical protein ACFLWZ_07505 [Chloroflexota bacterium]
MKKIIIAAALGAIIVGTILGAGLLGSAKGDKTMDVTNNGFVTDTVIPDINGAVPKITETATFALG